MKTAELLKQKTVTNSITYDALLKRMEESAESGVSFIVVSQNITHETFVNLMKNGFSVKSGTDPLGVGVTIIFWI